MRGEPNWLPIPFPRYFTPKTISEDGLIRLKPFNDKKRLLEAREKLHDEFSLSFPTLLKLTQDGGYHDRVDKAYNDLKNMKLAVKI